MTLDDIAHMADQERKREREVGDGVEGNYGTVTVPLKQWREQNAEIARLRQVAVGLDRQRGADLRQMQAQIDALEKRLDFHAVNNPLHGNPDDISLHELISVVDQRCELIERGLGGMTEEATFEKIDTLEMQTTGLFRRSDDDDKLRESAVRKT